MSNADQETVEILLVEDNPQDAEITLRALRRANLGSGVRWVKDGADALEFLFAPGGDSEKLGVRPRVVLLDIKMPRVDGIEVLRQMKSDPRTRPIPVVMLTSSREQSDLSRTYDLGVNSYLLKEVDFQRFSEEVARLGYYWMSMNQLPSL